MRADKLIKILAEYNPALLINVTVDRQHRFNSTVANMIANLGTLPPTDHIELFGTTDFLIRERVEEIEDAPPGAVQARHVLDFDVRL